MKSKLVLLFLSVLATISSVQTSAVSAVDPPPSKVYDVMEGLGVQCLEFSPDGSLLACGCFDSSVRVVDTKTGKTIRKLLFGSGECERIKFSESGAILMARTSTFVSARRFHVWRISDSKQLFPPVEQATKKDANNVSPLWEDASRGDLSPDGSALVLGDSGFTFLLEVRLSDGQVAKHPFNPLRKGVNFLAFQSDGKRIMCAADDLLEHSPIDPPGTEILQLEWPSFKLLESKSARRGQLWSLTSNGLRGAIEGQDGQPVIVSDGYGKKLATIKTAINQLDEISFSRDGSLLLLVGAQTELWDIDRAKKLFDYTPFFLDGRPTAAISPDNSELAVGAGVPSVKVMKVSNDKPK